MLDPGGGGGSGGPFAHYPATPWSNESAGETMVQAAPPLMGVGNDARAQAARADGNLAGVLLGLVPSASAPVEQKASDLKTAAVVGGGSVKRWSQHIADFDSGVDQLNSEYATARSSDFGVPAADSTGSADAAEHAAQDHADAVAAADAALLAELRRRYALLEDDLDGDAADVATLLDSGPSEEAVLALFQAGALPMAVPSLFPGLDFGGTDIRAMLERMQRYGDLPGDVDPAKVAAALESVDHLLGQDDFGMNGNRDDLERMLSALREMGPEGAEFVLLGLSDDELEQLEDLTTDTGDSMSPFDHNGLDHWGLIDFHALFLAGASSTQLDRLKSSWPSVEPELDSAGDDDDADLHWGDPPDLDVFTFDSEGNPTASHGDVDQGGLGDCWMMAKMAALEQGADSTWATDHVTVNPNGTITVTMYDGDGNAHDVVVTDQLPLNDDGDVALGGNDASVLWPSYYEKAFALASEHGSDDESGYGGIEGGWGVDDVMLMTGHDADEIDVDAGDVRDAVDNGQPVVVCTVNEDDIPDDLSDDWYENHCYYVVGVDGDGNVTLGNPWGTEEGTFTISAEQFESQFDEAAGL